MPRRVINNRLTTSDFGNGFSGDAGAGLFNLAAALQDRGNLERQLQQGLFNTQLTAALHRRHFRHHAGPQALPRPATLPDRTKCGR